MEGDTTRPIVDLEREQFRTYVFPETVFTAVTAYQNQLVCPIEKQQKMKNRLQKFRFRFFFRLACLHHVISSPCFTK
jgi:hypothetical protein